MCKFCNDLYYNDISMDYGWKIVMTKDSWDHHYYIDISHTVDLGYYGNHDTATTIKVNYCPKCGRKLEN